MNRITFSALAAFVLAPFPNVCGDGFIVIHEPSHVPPGHYAFAPLEVSRHHVEVKIDGLVATTSVDEEFYNPNDQRLEGTYLFPVPTDAHIDKFSMEVGGEMTDAELLPADKARQIYEDIVRKMRDPALLEYAGRDVFKARIFPIEPLGRKQVKITYTELLKSDAGSLTYTYPLGTEKFSSQPIKSLSIKVEIKSNEPLASIYSPSHKVEIKRDGTNQATLGYESKDEKPDTDFQLVITHEKRDVGLHMMSYKTDGDEGYFLLLAAPSVDTKDAKPAPKDVVFVLDTSGSMAGAKIKQAKKALEFCVENLNAEDRFEIVRFSTEAEPLFEKLVDANDANRKRATVFIRGLKPIGGTAIAAALKSALKIKPDDSARPFVVIFLTDGLPTIGATKNEDILAIARKSGGNARVFSFGIGSDVNTHLLDQLAESTRAFSQYVLPEEDIEVKLSNFFTRIKEPALTNLKLEFPGDVRVSKMYPSELPDLFKGDQLVLAGRYNGSGEVEAKLTGNAAGREQSFVYKVRFDEKNTEREFIPRLWATRRVGFLLDEIRLHGENNELRDEVTSLARQFGIVTPYTAYLIVEDEERRNVPMTRRSLQQFGEDKDARDSAGEAWSSFREKQRGAGAVGNAQSQNFFKYAEQSKAAISEGNSAALAGYAADAPAAKPAAARLAQYTQQTKFVNGRAFFQNGSQWVDGKTQNLTKHQNVQFNSDAYFDLVKKHPEAAQWLALGRNMQLALDDTIYEITE
jgi:Ca-activated chloride channel family protein